MKDDKKTVTRIENGMSKTKEDREKVGVGRECHRALSSKNKL